MAEQAQGQRASEREQPRADVSTEELSFTSSGERCAATLYRPTRAAGPVACVVMAQGFTLTRQDGVPRYAEHFARSGLAALTFDYRCLGDSAGEPRQLVDHEQQRADIVAAVGLACSLDGVDPDRVVLWGYSFGGAHVLDVAAADTRAAAAILHFPMVDGRAFLGMLGLRHALRITRSMVGALMRRKLVHLPATGPPGSLAMLTQQEAEPGFQAVRAPGSPWRNEFRARPTKPVATYRPVKGARHVRCPLLVCLGERDTIVSASPIAKAAERAPRGELRRYDLAHFTAFLDGFDAVIADQVAFLERHVAAPAPR